MARKWAPAAPGFGGGSDSGVGVEGGGVEGGALIVRSGLVRAERDESRAFVTSDTFLLLRVHEGWGGANGGGRFYVRNQVEKRVDVRAS